MKNFIVGAGGLAKEVLAVYLNSEFVYSPLTGFIDKCDEDYTLTVRGKDYPVYSETNFLENFASEKANINLFSAIGTPSILKNVSKRFKGFNFPNLIDGRAIFDEQSLQLGKGNIIMMGATLTVDIQLKDFNIVNYGCTIGHDTKLGSFNLISPSVAISGGVQIGNANLIGANATILQYLKIGDGNIVGAGAVVTKNIENNKIMTGIPAKSTIR